MRALLTAAVFLLCFHDSNSQKTKVPPKNYPSLLWEISGNGLQHPSYLFGTMHVSSKMAFHLSDSFYLGIRNADVVALETDMGTWQEDFSRYDLTGQNAFRYHAIWQNAKGSPSEYLTINSLRIRPYEKLIEAALYSNPSLINNFLYRSYERNSDFEEDTYLDLHIYQAGKKWGKKVCGVEDFHESMQLMKEAYEDAAKEKTRKERSYNYNDEFSYAKMEEAYRTGNLDLLDTIQKVNSESAAFDEKFMYRRNEIQAASIDSILRKGQRLFAGVGAAHLPGHRGVIEMLRAMGYQLRPIKMTERDSRHKEEVEKIRVPVQFSRQSVADGFFSMMIPGKLFDFGNSNAIIKQQQFADMSNGSYYMVTRIHTNSLLWGHSEETVLRKIDSVIYENVPGKILVKQKITRNGYKGYEVQNRTRRGDYQRYNIFVTPFEVVLFKMSGNGDYVKEGTEADQFFNSIQFRNFSTSWKKWSPGSGGFEIDFPHEPVISHADNWQFLTRDEDSRTSYMVLRTDIHNYDFVEEDSFDLGLMEESFASSEFIEKQLFRKQIKFKGYAALDAGYRYRDGSVSLVRFLIRGPHYYTLVAHGRKEIPRMKQFLNSFSIQPFRYNEPEVRSDTSQYFTVFSPVPLYQEEKISMYPENMYGMYGMDEDEMLIDRGTYKDNLVVNDSTGEKIFVSFSKPSRYYYDRDSATVNEDTVYFKTHRMNWKFLSRKKYELADKTRVFEYVVGDPKSSRYIRGKLFSKDGVRFRVETQGDTISGESRFVKTFFESFNPVDTVKGIDPRQKKSAVFFSDFFSSDSLVHKTAIRNVGRVYFDSADLPQMKKVIGSLNWSYKKYMDVKKDFVAQLSSIKSKESADYLKEIYFAAGDTVELQYTALQSLLEQQTAYAFSVFRDIMTTEPPVLLNVSGSKSYSPPPLVNYREYGINDYGRYNNDDFIEALDDSLQLTRIIFHDLLPLININDYENHMMNLLAGMIDSNLVIAADYETYMPGFLLEARQLLKKQLIREKNRSIEKAQEDENDNFNNYRNDSDYGNSQLGLYATLLMPFWDKNPAVPQFFSQLLNSSDKKLKYNTSMLMLRHQKALPDTMLRYFASLDEYNYSLYRDLNKMDKLSLYPGKPDKIALAKSRLLSLTSIYNKPDSIAYLDKLPMKHGGRDGFVYFFKIRMKKDDLTWRLATVGMISADPLSFEVEWKDSQETYKNNFTQTDAGELENDEPVSDQIRKVLKKLQYSKRNSAYEFYNFDDESEIDYSYQY